MKKAIGTVVFAAIVLAIILAPTLYGIKALYTAFPVLFDLSNSDNLELSGNHFSDVKKIRNLYWRGQYSGEPETVPDKHGVLHSISIDKDDGKIYIDNISFGNDFVDYNPSSPDADYEEHGSIYAFITRQYTVTYLLTSNGKIEAWSNGRKVKEYEKTFNLDDQFLMIASSKLFIWENTMGYLLYLDTGELTALAGDVKDVRIKNGRVELIREDECAYYIPKDIPDRLFKFMKNVSDFSQIPD